MIAKINQENLKNICKKYGILMVLLFGSHAKGNHRHDSDIDIGVLFSNSCSHYDNLTTELMSVFKEQVLDIAILNRTDSLLNYEIITNYKILYCENDEVFINFYINTIKKYNDTKKLLDFEKTYLKNFIGGSRDGIYQCDPPQVN